MQFVHIVTFRHADAARRISDADLHAMQDVVLETPGLVRANFHTPSSARDYYTDDGPSPQFVIESYFDRLDELEAALAADGTFQALAQAGRWASLEGADVEHQVMLSRPWVESGRDGLPAAGKPHCSYLVHYPGYAEDFFAWLNYYLAHHPQIMLRFPKIRGVEIYTRVDWIDAMPWRRANYMQRNKQVFDSPEDLTAALNSPVRHEMRADFEKFPPFHGSNRHFAMITVSLAGRSQAR